MMLGQGLQTGVIGAPADGPVAWATRDDLAETAARVLAEGGHLKEAVPLTGPQALDLAALAQILSRITGRTIERRVLPDEVFIDLMATMKAAGGGSGGRPGAGGPGGRPSAGGPGTGAPSGAPACGPTPEMKAMTRGLLGMYVAMHQGRFAEVTPNLGQVLDRPPRGVEEFLGGAFGAG